MLFVSFKQWVFNFVVVIIKLVAGPGIGRRNSEETITDEDAVSIVDSSVSASKLITLSCLVSYIVILKFNIQILKMCNTFFKIIFWRSYILLYEI